MDRLRSIVAVLVVCALAPVVVPATADAGDDPKLTVDSLIRTLASSGIATVDQPQDEEPVRPVKGALSPVRLLRSQVRNMVDEANARNGVVGAQIDALAPLGEGALPMSYFVAGYVAKGTTPGARFARRLMGRQEWEQAPTVVYPSTVLALFSADMTAALSPDAPEVQLGTTTRSALRGGPVGGASVGAGNVEDVCSALSGFISGGISFIYDAVTFQGTADVPLTLPELAWNTGVDFISGAIGTIVGTILPFLPAVRGAVGVIATIASLTSVLKNWTVNVTPTPSSLHFGVDGSGNDGKFVVTVDTGPFSEWPPALVACAQLVDVTLPSIGAKGAPVQWSLVEIPIDAGLTTYSLQDANYDANFKIQGGKAVLDYTTATETAKEHAKGEVHEDLLLATASVTRTDVQKLQDLVLELVLDQVPGFAQPILNPKLAQILTPIIADMTGTIAASNQKTATISHHELEPCKAPDAAIDPCLVGNWHEDQIALPLPPELIYSGGTGAVMSITPTGQMTIDYGPSAPLSISIAGMSGSGKLNGAGNVVITTTYEEKGTGSMSSTSPDGSQITASVRFAGFSQTFDLGGLAQAFTGTYQIENLDDPNAPDRLVITVPTSVGPQITVWSRVD